MCIADIRVRQCVLPTAGLQRGPRRVNGLRDVPNHLVEFPDIPGIFVERTPADDGRMIPVTHQDLGPFIDDGCVTFPLVVVAGVGIFTPDQVAEFVGPVEEARLENFLVQARAVVAAGHGHFDVVFQRRVRGRRPESIGIETLIENQALEDRLVVDEELAPGDGDLAQTKITFQLVQLLLAAVEREFEIIQKRRARLPQFLLLEIEHQTVLPRTGAGGRTHQLAVGESFRHERQVLIRAVDLGVNQHPRAVWIRHDGNCFNKRRADGFEPHRLPDAGGARVETTGALIAPRLLPAGLEVGPDIVQHLHHHFVRAGLEQLGDVETERHIPTDVQSGKLAVDIHPRPVIHAAEMDAQPLALHGRR